MKSKKKVNKLLVSAVAATVAGASGYASAGMMDTPANSNIIKVGKNGCEGKSDCKGTEKEHTSESKNAKEKCYGVVEAGHNDCGSADKSHSCMGQASVDGSGQEWVAVPKGLCDKLVGGSTEPYQGTEKPEKG